MSMSVCLCVCLSLCLSFCEKQTTREFFTKFLCVLPMAVARSFSGRVAKSQGEWAILRVFFPIDNALYRIAFGTHTKTAEPIETRFWMKILVGQKNHVLDGVQIPKRKGAIFGGCPSHSKALTIFAAAVAAAFAAKGNLNWPIY